MSFICIVCRDLLSNNPPVDDTNAGRLGAAALPVVRNTDIVATKCGHLYHLTCLRDWFNKQANPRQECPYCKVNVRTDDYQRIYPIGDEESEDIEAKLKKAKQVVEESMILKNEKNQVEQILEQTGMQLEDKKLAYDILLYEFQEKSVQLDSLQAQRDEQQQILQTIENNFTEMIEKLERDKAGLEKQLEESEMKLIMNQSAFEQSRVTSYDDESATMIRNLSLSHDILRKEIRTLQDQLRSTGKVNLPKRAMGSQTDSVPFALDSMTSAMSRMEIVDLCLKYFEEEKKQHQAENLSKGEHVLGSGPRQSQNSKSVATEQRQSIVQSAPPVIPPNAIPAQYPPQPTVRRTVNALRDQSTAVAMSTDQGFRGDFSFLAHRVPISHNSSARDTSTQQRKISAAEATALSLMANRNITVTPLQPLYHEAPFSDNSAGKRK